MKVKIEQRTVYHKFVELEIEIPNTIESDGIEDYILSIEDRWVDKLDHKLNETEFVIGNGLYDHNGHEDSESDEEFRYECEERKVAGHLGSNKFI